MIVSKYDRRGPYRCIVSIIPIDPDDGGRKRDEIEMGCGHIVVRYTRYRNQSRCPFCRQEKLNRQKKYEAL